MTGVLIQKQMKEDNSFLDIDFFAVFTSGIFVSIFFIDIDPTFSQAIAYTLIVVSIIFLFFGVQFKEFKDRINAKQK